MSATGKAAQIIDALLARVATLETGSPTLPVAWPEIDFDPMTDSDDCKYIAVSIFPNRPAWEGVSEGVMDQGLLQVSVVWPKGQGAIAPYEVAETVKAHFAKGTEMVSGATKVKVVLEPWAAQPLTEEHQVSIPVTVRWAA
jgi:hypothetical protein